MKLGNILDAARNQIKNLVIDNTASNPVTPTEGQIIYNTVTKRMAYWSTSSGTGAGWITLNPVINQSTSLTGEITGSGTGTVATVASPTLVSNKNPISSLKESTTFLGYDADENELCQISWILISDYITEVATTTNYNISVQTISGGANLSLNGSDGSTDIVPFIGTTNEVEVINSSGTIQIGLPNSITVSTINVTSLTINGVPYVPYTHPTQTAINIDGSGLQFVQDITVNTLGHTTAVFLGTLPSGSEVSAGVVRLANNTEASSGTSGLALQPSQVASMLSGRTYATTITSSSTVTHGLGTKDVIVQLYDTSNGETIYASVLRGTVNDVSISFGSSFPASVRVLITKIG